MAQRPRGCLEPLRAHESARDLVDRAHLLNRDNVVDLLQYLIMEFDVAIRPRLADDQARDFLSRFFHLRAGLNAQIFGLIACGDGAGIVRHHRHNDDGAAAYGRLILLSATGEIGIHIKIEPAQISAVAPAWV